MAASHNRHCTLMRKLLLFGSLLFLPASSFGQPFEAWVGGGVSNLTNTNIGSFDPTTGFVTLSNGFRINFRLALNTWRYFGHEIGYAYNRANWNIGGVEAGSSIHQGFYDLLGYAIPEGKGRIRPFVAGGVGFSNYVFPGYSATSGGGSTKFGYNYGAGVKVRVLEIFGVRVDYRQYATPKPFDFPAAPSGWVKQNEFSIGLGVVL